MMEWLINYGQALLSLLLESAPLLLVGFFLAGLLKVLIPEEKVYKHLGQNRFGSVALASLFGVPIPLCSCSVIPTAASLKKSGASKGATTSFLISAPETGLDSIFYTYTLLGPLMTLARPLAALLTALLTGSFVNVFVNRGWDEQESEEDGEVLEGHCHGDHDHGDHDHGDHDQGVEEASSPVGPIAPESGEKKKRRSPKEVLFSANRYAFVTLLDDLTPWLVVGFLISAMISALVPNNFFETSFFSGFWLSSLLMVLVGTPVYICASATTPVAATLIAKGLDPGAALVLLLVGPATNATTLLVVSRLLGKRVLSIYLLGVTLIALALGFVLSGISSAWNIDYGSFSEGTDHTGWKATQLLSGTLLFLLLAVSAVRLRLIPRWTAKVYGWFFGTKKRKAVVALGLCLVYLSTCFTVIGPGEAAWVLRWGDVVREVERPGLVVHWPLPVERTARIRTEEVRSVAVGYRSRIASEEERQDLSDTDSITYRGRNFADEAEMMTGDESIVSMSYSIHYRVRDPYAYLFRWRDARAVVSAMSEAAFRQVLSRRGTGEVLVGERDEVESEIRTLLQQEIDLIGGAVEVLQVAIQDAHAPADVHTAFRDVASALEDKNRSVREAEGDLSEILASGRAEAFSLLEDAKSYENERISRATGEANGFLSRVEAYKTDPRLTRLRLYLEALEAGLSEAQAIFLLGDDVDVDLWNTPERAGGGEKDAEDTETREGMKYRPY